MTDLHRIQTHARSILEGEGEDEDSPALVEAVARALNPVAWHIGRDGKMLDWPAYVDWRNQSLRTAQIALSTIRKHQAGE